MEFLTVANRKTNPKNSSNILSRFLLWYLKDTISNGANRQLSKEDILEICENDSSGLLAYTLESQWGKELRKIQNDGQPSFSKAVFSMALPKVWFITLLVIIMTLAKISQSIFIQQLLQKFVVSDDSISFNGDLPYYWAIGLCSSMLLIWLLWHHTFLSADKLAITIRSAVISLVYKKTLKLSNGSISSITDRHVFTLISTESQKIREMFLHLYYLFVAPIVLGVATYILWRDFGVICLAGIGVLLVFVVIQILTNRILARTMLETNIKTEKRVNTMNEIIRSMKLTKMYTWEESFADAVNALRRQESSKLLKAGILRAMNYAFIKNSVYIAGLAIFAVFYLDGRDTLSLPNVVLTITIFFSIRMDVVYYFPMAVQHLIEGLASCKKIEAYLRQGEISDFEMKTISQQKRASRIPSVSFEKVTATWSEGDLDPIMKGISFKADSVNNLVMIVGPSGSGKSSLLMAALNELIVKRGRVDVIGDVAYCPQQPWIFPGTVRQNILFGKKYNKLSYEKALKACGLSQDLEELNEGDLTVIGEKGTTFNDDQKSRINLARAVYHDADVYLLDEPLTSMDNQTGKEIFQKCVQGVLKRKIVLIVTRQIQYLEYATSIVCLQNNGECLEGTLNELSQQGINLYSILHPIPDEKCSDRDSAIETEESIQFLHLDDHSPRGLSGIYLDAGNKLRASMRTSSQASLHTIQSVSYEEENDEMSQQQQQHGSAYVTAKYFVLGIGWLATFGLIFSLLIGQVLFILTDYWLVGWAQGEDQTASNQTITFKYFFSEQPDNNFYVVVALVCASALWNIFRAISHFSGVLHSGRYLHDLMFESVLNAPMHFFNTTSTGKILSRFSRDINFLDEQLPWVFNGTAQMAVLAFAVVVVNCISVPYLVIIFVPFLIAFVLLRRYYMKSAVQIRYLEGNSRIPFYNHVTASLDGLTTIRAFNNQQKMLSEFHACNDHQIEARLMQLDAGRWFSMRVDLVTVIFSCCAVFAPLALKDSIDLDIHLVAISLVYALQLPSIVQWCLQDSSQVEALMESAERCFEYARFEPEIDNGENKGLRDTWPEYGLITAEGASFAYHTTLPYVLKKLFFCIRPAEKVGIVGRTGAGKSSLLNMLFRLGNTTGTVRIDGYPIEDLVLKDLRKAISVIPQNPMLFSVTLRKNLDPSSSFLDADIWEALEEVQMKDTVMDLKSKLNTEIIDSGYIFTVGERQLLCLARAILMQNKILVIDEAAEKIDYETDMLIQRTLREKFKEWTVLTVARRLNTVMDCDRVMVLSGGKVIEFDEPFELLQNSSGYFRKLVDQAGRNEASRLELQAQESKHFRHLQLLQTQAQYPGWHITTSKSKAEIIQYFGTKVLYETTV